jgi:hypothetical protein
MCPRVSAPEGTLLGPKTRSAHVRARPSNGAGAVAPPRGGPNRQWFPLPHPKRVRSQDTHLASEDQVPWEDFDSFLAGLVRVRLNERQRDAVQNRRDGTEQHHEQEGDPDRPAHCLRGHDRCSWLAHRNSIPFFRLNFRAANQAWTIAPTQTSSRKIR